MNILLRASMAPTMAAKPTPEVGNRIFGGAKLRYPSRADRRGPVSLSRAFRSLGTGIPKGGESVLRGGYVGTLSEQLVEVRREERVVVLAQVEVAHAPEQEGLRDCGVAVAVLRRHPPHFVHLQVGRDTAKSHLCLGGSWTRRSCPLELWHRGVRRSHRPEGLRR